MRKLKWEKYGEDYWQLGEHDPNVDCPIICSVFGNKEDGYVAQVDVYEKEFDFNNHKTIGSAKRESIAEAKKIVVKMNEYIAALGGEGKA